MRPHRFSQTSTTPPPGTIYSFFPTVSPSTHLSSFPNPSSTPAPSLSPALPPYGRSPSIASPPQVNHGTAHPQPPLLRLLPPSPHTTTLPQFCLFRNYILVSDCHTRAPISLAPLLIASSLPASRRTATSFFPPSPLQLSHHRSHHAPSPELTFTGVAFSKFGVPPPSFWIHRLAPLSCGCSPLARRPPSSSFLFAHAPLHPSPPASSGPRALRYRETPSAPPPQPLGCSPMQAT